MHRHSWVLTGLFFLVAAAIAGALYLTARYLPNPLTELLFPVSSSPWEISKCLFWPPLGALLLLRRHLPEGYWIALPVLLPALAVVCTLLVGETMPPPALLSLLAASVLLLWELWLRRRLPGGLPLWGLLALLLAIAYLLFTELPPAGRIFLDPRDVSVFSPIPF